MKFCLKTFATCSLLYISYLNAHFSNYFVQILIIRSKFQGGKDGPGEAKKIAGGATAPLLPYFPRLWPY